LLNTLELVISARHPRHIVLKVKVGLQFACPASSAWHTGKFTAREICSALLLRRQFDSSVQPHDAQCCVNGDAQHGCFCSTVRAAHVHIDQGMQVCKPVYIPVTACNLVGLQVCHVVCSATTCSATTCMPIGLQAVYAWLDIYACMSAMCGVSGWYEPR